MVKPKKLKTGSKIGIVSPSYWLDKNDLKKSAKGSLTKLIRKNSDVSTDDKNIEIIENNRIK